MKSLACVLLLLALGNGGIANASGSTEVAETQGAVPESAAVQGPEANAEMAQQAAPIAPPPYAAKLRADAGAVLKGPDFHQMQSGTVPVPRPWLEKWLKGEKETARKPVKAPDFSGLAQLMKILVVVALALLLAWLLWRGYQWLAPQTGRSRKLRQHGRAREAEFLPLQDDTQLPDNISDSAARAWQAGQASEALSLLYRGALASLASRHALSLPGGATEGDYLRLLRRSGKRDLAQGFNTITQAWVAQAYANRPPENFPLLLQAYRQHFEQAGSAT